MPHIQRIEIEIITGASGHDTPVTLAFNGHELEFDDEDGSTTPGARFTGTFEPHSFAHSVELLGPESGTWNIESISVAYRCSNEAPYAVHFGAVQVQSGQKVDIWQDRPMPIWSV